MFVSKKYLLIFILFLYACKETKSTDIGEVYKTDKDCFSEINQAKNDFKKGKKSYYLLRGFDLDPHREDEYIIKNFKKLNIEAKVVGISCIGFEKIKTNCYEEQMNTLLSEALGKAEIERIIHLSKREFADEENLKISHYTENGEMVVVDSLTRNLDIVPFHHAFLQYNDTPIFYNIEFEVENKNVSIFPLHLLHSKDEKLLRIQKEFNAILTENLHQPLSDLNLPNGSYMMIVKIKN